MLEKKNVRQVRTNPVSEKTKFQTHISTIKLALHAT